MAKEKVKKPFYKRWWVWVLAVIIIGSVLSNGNDSTSTEKGSEKQEEKAAPVTAPSKKEEEKSFKIGETVPVGDMTYIISSKEVKDQVGPSILPTKATQKFVVIEVTLKNGGNEAVTVDSSFFKLKRGEKTYEADSSASMSANQGEDGTITNSFFLQEVNPDSEVKGFVVFDVAPDVAAASDLQLQVQTGLFGTETEIITLQ
ncbi:DUF4352 domain-containing protein [Neobacillus niacini]|uniref:DUF4352 domain-containing protein n=1 Tax=Neobacillus niacini TaxID=86668 RepID=UPI003983BFEC